MFSIAQISPRSVARRRTVFFGLCYLIFLLGVGPMVQILARDGFRPLDVVILLLFMVLFGQVSFGVQPSPWSVSGFCEGKEIRCGSMKHCRLKGLPGALPSTAVVMPIYNEEVGRVFQGIRVMSSLWPKRAGVMRSIFSS